MFFVIFHVSVKPGSSKPAKTYYGFFFFHWSILLSLLLTNRQTDIEYADYFKVIKFQKKPSMKNGSFRFVGSRNWFVIHESRTLNSYSVKCCAISGKSKYLGGLHTLVIREQSSESVVFDMSLYYAQYKCTTFKQGLAWE